MGHRNADRVSIQQRFARGRTVADMQQQRWEVIARCPRCQLDMSVRLDWIIRLSGPGVSLWNRKARCRRLMCHGWAEFYAKAPGMTGFELLRIDERLPDR